MEKNPYTMAKLGLENSAMLRPQRDCGFYAKYVFLFLSLIQFLIILGLVLFMIYGNNHAATASEKHAQGLSVWLQECRVQNGALAKEKANLTRLLNASRSESRQIMSQLNRLNSTLKFCSADKLKLQGQLWQAEGAVQSFRECYQIVTFFNTTYPDKVKALEAQLQAQALQAELDKKGLAQKNQQLQTQVQKAEQQVAACQQDLLHVRTQVQKVGELENRVMSEMQEASQSLKSAVERALPSQAIWSCNTEEVRTLQTKCQNLSKQLDGYVANLGQRLEDRVYAVAKENAWLQKEKVSCFQDRQELNNKLTAQEQHATQEKDALQLACSTEKTAIYAEQQKLFSEKESLRQELDRIKQKCLVPPLFSPPIRVSGASGGTNPFASFSGNVNPLVPAGAPNAFKPPLVRAGGLPAQPSAFGALGAQGNLPAQRNLAPLGNTGPHRTSAHTGSARLEEDRKPIGTGTVSSYQLPTKPVGQPSG